MSNNLDIDKQNIASLCKMHKDNTSEIIKKMESKIPVFAQNYSDLYDAYLHMIDDLHGTFCMAEKEFIDKTNIDPDTMNILKKHYDKTGKQVINNIEVATSMFDAYVKMRISMIKSFDNCAHIWMESCGKMFSEFIKPAESMKKFF